MFDGNGKKSRKEIIDYYCWEELRHEIGSYLEEKTKNLPISFTKYYADNNRYCVALAAEDLLNWMSNLEEKHKKVQ